jgi:hypothetical protein
VIPAPNSAGRRKKRNGSGAARATGKGDQRTLAGGSSWADKKGPRPRGAPARLFGGGGETQVAGKFDDHCLSGRVVDDGLTLVMHQGFLFPLGGKL